MQIPNYENVSLCLKGTDVCIAQLESPKINNINQLTIPIFFNDVIKYGENYVFDIKTTGCQKRCSKRSNEKSARTGKDSIYKSN